MCLHGPNRQGHIKSIWISHRRSEPEGKCINAASIFSLENVTSQLKHVDYFSSRFHGDILVILPLEEEKLLTLFLIPYIWELKSVINCSPSGTELPLCQIIISLPLIGVTQNNTQTFRTGNTWWIDNWVFWCHGDALSKLRLSLSCSDSVLN